MSRPRIIVIGAGLHQALEMTCSTTFGFELGDPIPGTMTYDFVLREPAEIQEVPASKDNRPYFRKFEHKGRKWKRER
jgi:hypothetical protein